MAKLKESQTLEENINSLSQLAFSLPRLLVKKSHQTGIVSRQWCSEQRCSEGGNRLLSLLIEIREVTVFWQQLEF